MTSIPSIFASYISCLLVLGCVAMHALAVPPTGYHLVWSDEFSGPSLDTTRWAYRNDSKMWSTQTPANAAIQNGRLVISLKKEAVGGRQYTGGGIISKAAFRYGYYEASFKVPPGAGWHTSFWLMRHNGSGGSNPSASRQELDVCENDSVDLTKYGVNVHQWNPHKGFGSKSIRTPNLSSDFHTYGCEFTMQTVRYYFDGNVVATYDATLFPHSDQNIWLTSIAAGLGHTAAVDDSKLPATAEFAYVRFYQKD